MPKLTGYQRFQLKRTWIKRKDLHEKFSDFEEFVKSVCTEKGIEYHKPTVEPRQTTQVRSTAKVFPTK